MVGFKGPGLSTVFVWEWEDEVVDIFVLQWWVGERERERGEGEEGPIEKCGWYVTRALSRYGSG